MSWATRRRRAKRIAQTRIVHEDGRPNFHTLAQLTKELRLVELNVKAFGYELARRLASELPVRADTVARHVGLTCKPSTQRDMESDWVGHWLSQLKIPVVFHRKLWELAYVLQASHEHGLLRPGVRALGFACGQEPIASYLATCGVAVTATDIGVREAEEQGWRDTQQHLDGTDSAFMPHLIDRAAFDRSVTFEVADMNAIPPHLRDYDLCWSICAIEHLGSIEKGLTFIENALSTLRPGGLSVHTIEFNVHADGPTIDNWVTVLFQKRHLERLAEKLRAAGHWVAEFDWDFGDQPLDRFVDLPPWLHDLPQEQAKQIGEPHHLKVGIDGFVATCFGLVIRKLPKTVEKPT